MPFWDGFRGVRPADKLARERQPRTVADLIGTLVLIAGLLAVAVPSSELRAGSSALTINPAEGPIGATVVGNGTGFPAKARIEVSFAGQLVGANNLRANAAGSFALTFTVPALAPGNYTIVAAVRAARGGSTEAFATVTAAAAFQVLTLSGPNPATWSPIPASAPSSTPSPTAVSATPSATLPPATTAPTPTALPTRTPGPTAVPTAVPTTVPTAAPTPRPAPSQLMLFGLGPTIDSSKDARLTIESKVGMLTAWYNGPNDLGWVTDAYHRSMYASQYAAGKSLHLIVFAGGAETTFSTSYGSVCGRQYPLSPQFIDDITQVAGALSGSGRLYVTLFTEFQTYPCTDNAWNPNASTNNYYLALKDRYLAARATIRSAAPNAWVSLGWGGWQARFDNPATGAGRSMFQHLGDVMGASDFQSFQAMQSDGNVDDVRAMTRTLGAYGPVMLAHYKPNGGSQSTFDADTTAMLTSEYLTEMRNYGMFAWSFMDQANLNATASTYQRVRDALLAFGR